MNPTIELLGVRAGYLPGQDVLHDVNLSIGPGLTQPTGANGSGKSTLLEVMAGTLRIRSGSALLAGHPVHTRPAWQVRSVCSAGVALFPGLTVDEHASLLQVADVADRLRCEQRMAAYGLQPWLDVPVGELSTGNLRKAWIVLSTAAERPVVLLDEPFTGLDVDGVAVLVREVAEWQHSGRTVVLVTHQPVSGLDADQVVDAATLGREAVTNDQL